MSETSCQPAPSHTPIPDFAAKCAESVVCFICGVAYPRYRLLPDVQGVPRLIDTKTIPCDDCLAQCREFEDDGK